MLQYNKRLMLGRILIMYVFNSSLYGYTDLGLTDESHNYFVIRKY
jgi:hypothetical protein